MIPERLFAVFTVIAFLMALYAVTRLGSARADKSSTSSGVILLCALIVLLISAWQMMWGDGTTIYAASALAMVSMLVVALALSVLLPGRIERSRSLVDDARVVPPWYPPSDDDRFSHS